MGGKRLNTGFIEDEKQRVGNYKRRTANLMKKAKELETLCDIQVCVIMSGPKLSGAGRNIPARIFPPELDKAHLVLRNFKNATLNKTHRSLTLSEVLGKAKRQPKTAAKNPDNNGSWYEDVRKLPLPQLEALYGSVTEKLKHVTSLCNLMVPSPRVNMGLVDPTVHDFCHLTHSRTKDHRHPPMITNGDDFDFSALSTKSQFDQTLLRTQDYRYPMITNDDDFDMSALLMMTKSQFDQTPPCPHDYDPSLADPYSNLMTRMLSEDDVSTQFMEQSPIESNNNSNDYNNVVPRYDNNITNLIDFSSFGVVNNNNYNSWLLNNPSTPMWCLSTQRVDEESETSFGGFRF